MQISRKGYYKNIDLQYEIIHQHKHRETFFLPHKYNDKKKKWESQNPIRWLNASCRKFLKKHFNRYDFLEKDMNLYFSLTTYKDFPTFSYCWKQKSQEQEIWKQHFQNYVHKHDFFIETDAENPLQLKKSWEDAISIKEYFDKFKIKYSTKFSGSKGYHFLSPHEEWSFLGFEVYNEGFETKITDFKKILTRLPVTLKNAKTFLDQVMLFKVIALRMKLLLACETIDTAVQDVKRVCKTGYSWDIKSNLIAYPLSDEQLLNFTKELVKPRNVIGYNNHRRGLLWRHTHVPKKEREENIMRFLQELGILKQK